MLVHNTSEAVTKTHLIPSKLSRIFESKSTTLLTVYLYFMYLWTIYNAKILLIAEEVFPVPDLPTTTTLLEVDIIFFSSSVS